MNRIMKRITNYLEYYAKVRTHQILLTLSERQLEDAGISKELVLKGTSAWPWRFEEPSVALPVKASVSKIKATSLVTDEEFKRAMDDLHQMSDRELRDLGITRGEINTAVRYGVEPKAA